MTKTYMPKSITKTPSAGNDTPSTFSFAYTREVDLGDGEVITSNPHRGSFPDTPEGRAAEYTISADGETRTGQQILDEFGVS